MDIQIAKTPAQLQEIAELATVIWHEHFTSILSDAQIDYMVEKFQSYSAISQQVQDGYEYYQLRMKDALVGYVGVHAEDNRLFLSKLYIRKDCRGQHLSTKAFDYLKELCRQQGLTHIWLTCNKYNENSLAVYKHFGFVIVDSQVADIGNGFVMDDYILEYPIH